MLSKYIINPTHGHERWFLWSVFIAKGIRGAVPFQPKCELYEFMFDPARDPGDFLDETVFFQLTYFIVINSFCLGVFHKPFLSFTSIFSVICCKHGSHNVLVDVVQSCEAPALPQAPDVRGSLI